MQIQSSRRLLVAALALVLLAGCDAAGGVGQVPSPAASPAATLPAPTSAPATVAAPAPTAPAAPSATAQPTPLPTVEAPTSAPAATAAPGALLPADQVWVRLGNTLAAQGEAAPRLDVGALGHPPVRYGALAAPDGSALAYIGENDRLVIVDMAGKARQLPAEGGMNPVGFVFSPDGRALAATLTDGQRWQLQIFDLQSGAARALGEGASMPTGDGPSLTPRPLAWTPAGLIVDRVLWASDAMPQGLGLIDPDDASQRALDETPHLQAIPSADGQRVALVTGELPLGGGTPMFALSVLDVAGGKQTEVVARRPGLVKALRWSPDGAKLLYTMSESYESSVTTLVAVGADGANEQRVDFGVAGFELPIHDLAWRDAATPLVLVANQAGQVELRALPLGSFDATGLRPLGSFGAPPEGQVPQILYVPGA